MRECLEAYIDSRWRPPADPVLWTVTNPATEEASGRVALGGATDVAAAVAAAKAAFAEFGESPREARIAILEAVVAGLSSRAGELAEAISEEMGSPIRLSREGQVPSAILHTEIALATLRTYPFETWEGKTLVSREPIGVCALIAPWNWPAGTIMTKLAPALATGCTVVLKPSEYAPYSARIIAEVIDQAGVPAGVFNMIYGDGPTVGAALSEHPDVAMVSITGSTRAGIEVARRAAPTIKRVHQELGGKSPNILLESAAFETAVPGAVRAAMVNSGQACVAPTRLLVPHTRRDEAYALAAETAAGLTVGSPQSGADLGPLVNAEQWRRVQAMIQKGLDEGARLLAGGTGRPQGLDCGYYVRPTVLADTTPEMAVVREEIFGPVLAIQTYADLDDAVNKANDTPYGLGAYVHGADLGELRRVGRRLAAGQVHLYCGNRQIGDPSAPFGGVKQSGNGRERGAAAFEAYTEIKAYLGCTPEAAA